MKRTQPKPPPDDVRPECYAAMRDAMLDGIRNYYAQHPDLLLDDRSQMAVKYSLEGLRTLYDVLDRYEITRRVIQK